MEIIFDLLLSFFEFLPLITGAYITILILRFPDLTMEASWSLSTIVTCLFVSYIPSYFAPIIGFISGALCGVLTSLIFRFSGKSKLLAGLISYNILIAFGYHLLGEKASIILDSENAKFGFYNLVHNFDITNKLSFIYYCVFSMSTFLIIFIWQKSKVGIKSRLIGQNPFSSIFYKISLNKYFSLGLILSNAIIGLGGGLWGIYHGYGSNAQGIGMVINAFLALLIGDELLKIIKLSKRSIPISSLVGTLVFVFITQLNEMLITEVQEFGSIGIKPTDKTFFISFFLVIILWLRRSRINKKNVVSQW